jgi:hypothetical protein
MGQNVAGYRIYVKCQVWTYVAFKTLVFLFPDRTFTVLTLQACLLFDEAVLCMCQGSTGSRKYNELQLRNSS